MKNLKIKIATWDWKEQPPWGFIIQAIDETEEPTIIEIETGSDEYAIAIAPKGTSLDQAAEAYTQWLNRGE